MRSEKEIISNIIQNPDYPDEVIYNTASYMNPNVDTDQSTAVLLTIKNLKKYEKDFLQHLADITEK